MSRCSASIRAPQERLESFEQAVRQVYASTMDISALEYRRLPDLFPEICPDFPTLAGMIRAAETPGLRLWQDAVSGRAVCGWE